MNASIAALLILSCAVLSGCSDQSDSEIHVRTVGVDQMSCDYTTLKVYKELDEGNDLDGYSIQQIGGEFVGVIFLSGGVQPHLESTSLKRFAEDDVFEGLSSITVPQGESGKVDTLFRRGLTPQPLETTGEQVSGESTPISGRAESDSSDAGDPD